MCRALYCNEDVSVDMPVSDKDKKLLMKTREMRPASVGKQLVIEQALHVFQETILDRRIEGMVDIVAISLLETTSHNTVMSKTRLFTRLLKRFYAKLSLEALSTKL